MFVTSFHTFVTQKRTQSESLHSKILDVHVINTECQNYPFLSVQLMLDKDLMLSPQLPLKLVMNEV